MDVKLGLYEIIENRLDEWRSYEPALQLYFVSSDIETYGKYKFKKSIDRSEHLRATVLSELNKNLYDNELNAEEKKQTYLKFIERLCKPDKTYKKVATENEDGNENYNVKDEFEEINRIKEEQEAMSDNIQLIENRIEQLNEIKMNTSLSEIENYALEYINSKRIEKHPKLELFTLQGVIQIANRAAYKLILSGKIMNK